jgi:hypothetical protein
MKKVNIVVLQAVGQKLPKLVTKQPILGQAQI